MTYKPRTRRERLESLRDKYALAIQIKHSPTATAQQKADAARAMVILNKLRDRIIAKREAWLEKVRDGE